MESLYLQKAISAANRRNPVNPIRFWTRKRRIHFKNRRFLLAAIRSKQSDFQDFQGYAKPSRLLPATEVKICTETSLRTFSSFIASESRSLFKVKIQTSNIYGSNLSDLNAGILLCLIDENGDSILQRIPASLMAHHSANTDNDTVDLDTVRFQRGTCDEFAFEGPRLGKVVAIWISLESGQWRLAGVSLTIINAYESSLEEDDGEKIQYISYQYDFEVDDVLLGEGGNASMYELRPSHITELSVVDPFTLLAKSTSQSTSTLNAQISNEESMKEYEDLKFSLLLYDAILIFVGTSITSLSVGENYALAFLVGGLGGFLCLLLLQKSIDGLPAPESISKNRVGKFNSVFGGFKAPLSSLALAVGISFLALKCISSGDDSVPFLLTPKQLFVGMLGFLACKVAVVLAAFKTLPVSLKEYK